MLQTRPGEDDDGLGGEDPQHNGQQEGTISEEYVGRTGDATGCDQHRITKNPVDHQGKRIHQLLFVERSGRQGLYGIEQEGD